MGKRTAVDAYRLQQRGGKGVINIRTTEKTGKVVAIKSVLEEDELMVITRNGVVNRQRVDEIRVIGRATQGVRLVNLDAGDQVMDVARVIQENGEEGAVTGDLPPGAEEAVGETPAEMEAGASASSAENETPEE